MATDATNVTATMSTVATIGEMALLPRLWKLGIFIGMKLSGENINRCGVHVQFSNLFLMSLRIGPIPPVGRCFSGSRWSPSDERDPIPLRPLVNLASPVGAEDRPESHRHLSPRDTPSPHPSGDKPVLPSLGRTSFAFRQTFRRTYLYLVPIGPTSSALRTTRGSLLFRVSLSVRSFFSSNSGFLLSFHVMTLRRLTSDSSS